MWVANNNFDWLDNLSKAWPILLTVSSGIAYFIGTNVRARVNDAEQLAITNAVEKQQIVITGLVDQVTRAQEHIRSLILKVDETCKDKSRLEDRVSKLAEDLARLSGHISKGKGGTM